MLSTTGAWPSWSKALNKTADYEIFIKRAANYKKVIDTSTGFARPKDSNGSWLSPFDPKFIGHGKDRHYTEANAWQYTWFVPHDVQGLINLEGGREKFVSKLDSLFTTSSDIHSTVSDVTGLIGQYAHGNEPSHHTAYFVQLCRRSLENAGYGPECDGQPLQFGSRRVVWQ